jgi:hypothetical protein
MNRMTLGIAATLCVPLALTVGSTALEAQEAMAEHCTASFSHEAIPVQAEPVMLKVSLSHEIGDLKGGMASEESGIVVKEVKTADEGTMLSLDTSKAVAGEWKLGITGSEGACDGKVKVKAAAEKTKAVEKVQEVEKATEE